MSEKWVDVTSECRIMHDGATWRIKHGDTRITSSTSTNNNQIKFQFKEGYRCRWEGTSLIECLVEAPDTVTVTVEGKDTKISRTSAIALRLLKE